MENTNKESIIIIILLIAFLIAFYFLTYYTAYQEGIKSVSHGI
ncbi:MAG TPA: hypothetical protein PLV43_11480 [Aequorivita sp.]|nr:hypothetical protein [Aequorivita sp.]